MNISSNFLVKRHVDVVVSVSEETMATTARSLWNLFDISRNDDLSVSDRHRMAGAFATLAYSLPVRTYDLIDWLAADTHFNREAIAHYAKDHFGMKRATGRR